MCSENVANAIVKYLGGRDVTVEHLTTNCALTDIGPTDAVLKEGDRQRLTIGNAYHKLLLLAVVVAARNGLHREISPIDAALDRVQSESNRMDNFADFVKPIRRTAVHCRSDDTTCTRPQMLAPEKQPSGTINHHIGDGRLRSHHIHIQHRFARDDLND